ncbi:hypothetical protein OC834_006484 [Tilletia horrida]|uniref:Extracellular membrane protein CFEM domain-containing protein n=1 Tax=Tilletia horrida TaxID=155126 RepID=A0AAN6JN26_9BASI|nr:hypothetical protein OC842_006777 [Tilletia horrida]KAK0521866.1 hypothetical protein OC835_006757 [Tilletia horrida]KAK0521910.1 hypothetical protein OC834_006484 [Tilletia horrida]
MQLVITSSLLGMLCLFATTALAGNEINNQCVALRDSCAAADRHDGYTSCMCTRLWTTSGKNCVDGCYTSLYAPGLDPHTIRANCINNCNHRKSCPAMPPSCHA